jgi:hypothetical protein
VTKIAVRSYCDNSLHMAALRARDGHFLAGFVEAEGCFQLTAINGGANWICGFDLALRDDDADLLVEMHEITGLGALRTKPARETSKPQVLWSIQRRSECRDLADLLERFPLRGRKRLEVEVWRAALLALDRSPRDVALPRLAAEIRSLKRYVNPTATGPAAPATSADELTAYLGGFFTGEGHLSLKGPRCRAVIKLRADDRPLLETFAAATNLGRIFSIPRRGSDAPQAAWVIYRRDELESAACLLSSAGLRGRKAGEFAYWKHAALELARAHEDQRPAQMSTMSRAAEAIHAARRYRQGRALDVPSRADRQRDRCVQALRAAAAATTGPLTVSAYNAQRTAHPLWPNRNTITRAFGGWPRALAAAGLSSRTGRPRGRPAGDPDMYTPAQLDKRAAERRRTIEVVAQIIATNGSPPTVHEYLAWRIAHDKSLPCLAKVYDLFPAGWSSVKKLATLHAQPATAAA